MTQFLAKYGYAYIGTNKTADLNIMRSARSLKQWDKDAHITAFIDQDFRSNEIIDNVVRIKSVDPHESLKNLPLYPDQGILAKVRMMRDIPYEYCIFSDYDIHYTASIRDIFSLLENGGFDFCATHDEAEVAINSIYPDVPETMVKFHLGIIGFHNNSKMQSFFSKWREETIALASRNICGGAMDEQSFSYTAYKQRDLRWSILSSNYCCRFIFPFVVRGEVKAFHGRSENYQNIVSRINATGAYRVGYMDQILETYEPYVGFVRK